MTTQSISIYKSSRGLLPILAVGLLALFVSVPIYLGIIRGDIHDLPPQSTTPPMVVEPVAHDYMSDFDIDEFRPGSFVYGESIVLYTGQEYLQIGHPCLIENTFTSGIVSGNHIIATSPEGLKDLPKCDPSTVTYPAPFTAYGGGLPGMFGVQRFEKGDGISGLIVLSDGTTYPMACSFEHAPLGGTSHGGGILGFDPNLPLCQSPSY